MKNNENNYDRFVILRCDFTYRIPIILWPKWNNTGIIVVNRDVHWPSKKLYADVLFICDSSSIYNFENAVLSIKDHKTLHELPKYLYDNNIQFTLMYDEYYHMNAHPLHILETTHNNDPTHITDISQWNPGTNNEIIPKTNIYLSGGRTGDLIHVLSVIYANWVNGKGKGILYISDRHGGDNFSLGVNKTCDDIKPILMHQEYIQDVIMYTNQDLSTFINLNEWRNYIHLKFNWFDMLSHVYKINMFNVKWIHLNESYNKYPELKDIIVIHHSLERKNNDFPWEKIISNNKCIFITCNINEYNNFKYKHLIEPYIANNLVDFVSMIYSSKCFIGNMSMPCALAWAIGHPLLCALGNSSEQPFYMCPYISWFKDTQTYNIHTVKDLLSFTI